MSGRDHTPTRADRSFQTVNADRYIATRPRSTAWVQPMPDYPTDEPITYERQAGADVGPAALFTDALQAQFSEQPAVWRPPNAEQLAKLEAWADEKPGVPALDSAHVAVIDGYQDPTPGYAGPLAVLVYSHMYDGEGVTTVALSNLADPREEVDTLECDTCGYTEESEPGLSCPECDYGTMKREGADQ